MIGNIFNIGSGHTQSEQNNTIARLGKDAKIKDGTYQQTYINDGPPTLSGQATASLEKKLNATLKWINEQNQKITKLNLTGHSRGAFLSLMIATYILDEKKRSTINYKDINEINIINLDPVRMCANKARALASQGFLKRYHAIIMRHEGMNKVYPLYIVRAANDEDKEVQYTIPMPGKHGSGTQPLTSAIGKTCEGLIKKFMCNRGTLFNTGVAPSDYEFCELFASILIENKKNVGGKYNQMLIRDDGRNATAHKTSDQSWVSISTKRGKIIDNLTNRDNASSIFRNKLKVGGTHLINGGAGGKPVDENLLGDYFINMQHLRYFYKTFPQIFYRLRYNKIQNKTKYEAEVYHFDMSSDLYDTRAMLEKLLGSNLG